MLDKVSIVIPVYNGERYLEESINSALNQTYQNIEIIVVDDGSIDNSPKILEKYSDKLRIITKKNGGVASAMNAGIREMKGEWFKLLGADDILYPQCVEELMKEVKLLKDKKKSILYSNYYFIDSDGKIKREFIEKNFNKLGNFDFNVRLLHRFRGNMISSIIHREIINKYGLFDKNFNINPDYELWLRYCILHDCRLYLVPKILIKYRIHTEMLSVTIPHKKILMEADNVRKYILQKLDSKLRYQYEISLWIYKITHPKLDEFRRFVRGILFESLPWSVSKYIVKAYRSLKYT